MTMAFTTCRCLSDFSPKNHICQGGNQGGADGLSRPVFQSPTSNDKCKVDTLAHWKSRGVGNLWVGSSSPTIMCRCWVEDRAAREQGIGTSTYRRSRWQVIMISLRVSTSRIRLRGSIETGKCQHEPARLLMMKVVD
jgi:hypothetical protein